MCPGSPGFSIHRRRRRAPRGFTLIEVVVTIVVGTIVVGSAGSLILTASRQHAEVAARCELVDVAARAMEQTLRYLREIPQDAGRTGLAQIATATASEIRFGSYGFRQNGTVLEMTTNGGLGWHPMARDASAFVIGYTNRTGVALTSFPLSAADRNAVRVIQIRLTLTRGSESRTIQTSIYLRAFMNEVSLDA